MFFVREMITGTCTQTLRGGAVFGGPRLPVAAPWLWDLHTDPLKVWEEKDSPHKSPLPKTHTGFARG